MPLRVQPHRRARVRRCAWAEGNPLLQRYHDEEWGVAERDSRKLWETLVLDGFQAGLAWLTILRKRQAFRKAFAGFEPDAVARFGSKDVRRLLADEGIVRSRAKIVAAIGNARAYLTMQAAGEDFSRFVWGLAGGTPIQGGGGARAKSPLSEKMSRALVQRGFKFVGPVCVYAWMQANGIVNDHDKGCFRRLEVQS
jgi:DNA-3-methyladenine glycosylase I